MKKQTPAPGSTSAFTNLPFVRVSCQHWPGRGSFIAMVTAEQRYRRLQDATKEKGAREAFGGGGNGPAERTFSLNLARISKEQYS